MVMPDADLAFAIHTPKAKATIPYDIYCYHVYGRQNEQDRSKQAKSDSSSGTDQSVSSDSSWSAAEESVAVLFPGDDTQNASETEKKGPKLA